MRGPIPSFPRRNLPRVITLPSPCPRECGDPSPVVPAQNLPRDYLPSLPCPRGCGDPSPLFPRRACPVTISPPLSSRMRGPIPVVPSQNLPRMIIIPSPCPRECGDPSSLFPRKTCPVITSPPSLSSRMRGPIPLASPTPTGADYLPPLLVLAHAGTHTKNVKCSRQSYPMGLSPGVPCAKVSRMRGPISLIPAQNLPRDYLPSLVLADAGTHPSLFPHRNLPRDYLPSLLVLTNAGTHPRCSRAKPAP